MRSKIVIQKPTDTSVGLIGVDSLLELYDNTKSGDLVVVYPGTYDLGANGIKLKDGVNFLFMPGVVINSTNPSGTFYDDGVEVHCTIQGSPKIINGAGAAINLTNQSSSCPLNNKNLTVQNLPDPLLFNEGDIVTVEGGATYKHNGTTWKPLVEEYDFYFNGNNIDELESTINSLNLALSPPEIKVIIDLSDRSTVLSALAITSIGYLGKIEIQFIKAIAGTYPVIKRLDAAEITITGVENFYIGKGSGGSAFGTTVSHTVQYAKDLITLIDAELNDLAKTSSNSAIYKLVGADPTVFSNWEPQYIVNSMGFDVSTGTVYPAKYYCLENGQDDFAPACQLEYGDLLPDGELVVCMLDIPVVMRYLTGTGFEDTNYSYLEASKFTGNNAQLFFKSSVFWRILFYSFDSYGVTFSGSCLYISEVRDSNLANFYPYFSLAGVTIFHSDIKTLQGQIVNFVDFGNGYFGSSLRIENSRIGIFTMISDLIRTIIIDSLIGKSNRTKYQFLSSQKTIHGFSTIKELFTGSRIKNVKWGHNGDSIFQVSYSLYLDLLHESTQFVVGRFAIDGEYLEILSVTAGGTNIGIEDIDNYLPIATSVPVQGIIISPQVPVAADILDFSIGDDFIFLTAYTRSNGSAFALPVPNDETYKYVAQGVINFLEWEEIA